MAHDIEISGLAPQMLLDRAVIDDPYPFYRRLVSEAPVWRVPGTDVVIVSSFAAISEAVKRVADFSSNIRGLLYRGDDGVPLVLPFDGGEGVDTLATADPPVHTAHRSAVFPELVSRRMATLRPEVEELARRHLDAARTSSSVEAMGAIANAIPIRVVSKLIGFRSEEPEKLLRAAFDSTAMLAATQPLSVINECMERTFEVVGWIAEQLQQAREAGDHDGIISAIVTAIDAGEMGEGEGMVIMHTLLSAGGESTTSLLGNAMHLMATMPDLQARLRSDRALLTPFIEEVLRLESPFRYHLRHAPADTELMGVPVPAGATVLLLWAAANRDPAEYDRPDEVVVEREAPRHHLGFGRGIHLCVGAPLARLEAEVVLGLLLDLTSNIALDDRRPPERENSLMVRRFAQLPLVLEPA